MRKHVSDTGWGPVIDIRFETADTSHLSLVLGLLRDAALWLRHRNIDYWQNWVDPPAHHVEWVADGLAAGEFRLIALSDTTIGCVRVSESDELFWGSRPEAARYVHSLTVDRNLTGRALGAAAIDALAAEARSWGSQYLRLDCGVGCAGLREYYEAHGFEAAGETEVDGERLVLYERALVDR